MYQRFVLIRRLEKNDCEKTISDFGEFGVLYGNFYAPSLDLEVTELFGRAATLLVYIEGRNPIHVDIDI
jgi:hypothetical protein